MADKNRHQPAGNLGWTLAEALRAAEGILLGGPVTPAQARWRFDAVSIDSRRIAPQNLFVAIAGGRFDGHDFAPDAVTAGVRLVVIAGAKASMLPWQDWERRGIRAIAVADTMAALGNMARFRRLELGPQVVAITGSNGKTTTKEMTAAILRQRFAALATRGNLNNEIGLPLTLFELAPEHQWAVLELGMNHPGEMRRLGRICLPDIAVITNIGRAHLEGLKTLAGVASAKGELLETIRPEGAAILNAGDPLGEELARRTDREILWFGEASKADVRAENVRSRGWGSTFTLILPSGRIPIELQTPGEFMVINALAAAAAGFRAGLAPEEIQAGLAAFRSVPGRMQVERIAGGICLIDDTYNANPDSMAAAIRTVVSLAREGRSMLIAGDMFELGEDAETLHREIGRQAAAAGLTKLLLTGSFAAEIRRGAQETGMTAADVFCGDLEALLVKAREWLKPGDWVLVKGSRAMGMERIALALKAPQVEMSGSGRETGKTVSDRNPDKLTKVD